MDEATPVRARCLAHPGVTAIALCASCGAALCLDCAIPVRGEVLGVECVANRIPESGSVPETPVRPTHRTVPDRIALAGMTVALVASLLPWSRFGVGSGAFGGWGTPLRYGSLVGPLAAAGLVVLWLASRPGGRAERARAVGAFVIGALVVAVSILAIARPVPFTRASVAPFLAIAGGLTTAFAWPAWSRLRPDRTKRVLA